MYASAAPASVASRAERGVTRWSAAPTKAPAASITPERKQAATPTFQASSVTRPQVHRVDHEVEEQEDRWRVEPEGLGRHVVTPFGERELLRLPRIIQVAGEQREAGPRQDPPEDQRVGQLQQRAPDGRDDDQVDEVVDREPEERIEIPAHEEGIAQGAEFHPCPGFPDATAGPRRIAFRAGEV